MTAGALFHLSISKTDGSDIEHNILAYAVAEINGVADQNAEVQVEPLITQTFMMAKMEDTNCRLLAGKADGTNSR